MRIQFISVILIIIVGFFVYGNSLHNEFLWDDELLILSNAYIKDIHNLFGLFTKNITYSTGIKSNSFRPLQMFTYALNYALGKDDVRFYHFTNIVIHILVAIMLYWLTQIIFKNEATSLLTALLFVSHPIHTEAVTYISGRADPLVALFILLSLIMYIKFYNKKSSVFYCLSIISYILALLSKEIALVVPLLIVAYDYIYTDKKHISFKMQLPFFLFALSYIVLRTTVLNFPVQKTVIGQYSFFQRLPAVFQSLTMYLQKLILPINLHMEYEPIVPPIMDIQVILGVIITLIGVLSIIVFRKKEKLITFALIWFTINFLPISNLYPLNAFFAEHWAYTPSVGLFVLVGWAAVKVFQQGRTFRLLSCLVVLVVLAGNFCLTRLQNRYWKSPEHFYKRTLQYAPHSARVYYRLTLFYFKKGMIDQGIEQSKKAIEISPYYVLAYESLSTGYILRKDYHQAIELCLKALEMEPNSYSLHNNLGVAYAAQGWTDKAIIEFKKAISLNPTYASGYNNLAIAYFHKKLYNLAIEYSNKARELNFTNLQFLEALEPFRERKGVER
jgi:tetratricopeptide (TPR) repeat protein